MGCNSSSISETKKARIAYKIIAIDKKSPAYSTTLDQQLYLFTDYIISINEIELKNLYPNEISKIIQVNFL